MTRSGGSRVSPAGGTPPIPRTRARTGAAIPVLGQGTWRLGEDARLRRREIETLRLGFDLGMTLVDTAEMYAGGGAERVVGEAIRGRREGLFLVSKVLPENASRRGTIEAAEKSLERLGTGWLDLFLLHWPGPHPLEETLAAFDRLVADGKIVDYGVSNFDAAELDAAEATPHGRLIAANQVLYNLEHRGIDRRLLPRCVASGIVVMAYAPLGQGRLGRHETLRRIGDRHGASPFQVALAWTIQREGVVAIPKASDPAHVRDNAAAAALCLTEEDLAEIDRAFPLPTRDIPLETA